MGFSFEAAGDTMVGHARVDASLHNPTGRMHGAVVAGLADSTMGHLCIATLGPCTNTDLSVRFLRPVLDGKLRAEARFVRQGRNLSLVACDVHDGDGRLVAVVQSQFVRLTP